MIFCSKNSCTCTLLVTASIAWIFAVAAAAATAAAVGMVPGNIGIAEASGAVIACRTKYLTALHPKWNVFTNDI